MSNWRSHVLTATPESECPVGYRGLPLSGIKKEPLRDLVVRYASNFGAAADQGIAPLLIGPPGTYKTYAAAWLAERIRTVLRLPVGFVDVGGVLPVLERSRFSADTAAMVSHWRTVPWCVIDDFTLPKAGGFSAEIVQELTFARYAAGLPTCYTGNVRSPDDLKLDPVGRRILERSAGYRLYVGLNPT